MDRIYRPARVFELALVLSLIFLLGAAARPANAEPGIIPAGLAEITTVISEAETGPGSASITRPRCPAGSVALGGGADVENVVYMRVLSAAPTIGDQMLFQVADGIRAAPDSWRLAVANQGSTRLGHKGAAICAPVEDVVTVVTSTTVRPSASGYARAQCPAGSWAVSGGAESKSSLLDIRYSVPLFGASGERLFEMAEGRGEAPRGWMAGATNRGDGDLLLKVAAVCAPWDGLESVIVAETVAAGGFDGQRARCPKDMAALGGGVDLANTSRLELSASAPTFEGSGFRLFQQPLGETGAPDGWQGIVRSAHGAGLDFKVAAVCAPTSVAPVPELAGLSNISTRGHVGTGDDVMIGGFIVAGGSLDVSLRALGPSLADDRGPLSGRLPDPVLRLHSGATLIAEADDWPPADSAERAWIELLGMVPPEPQEAVMVRRFSPGGYTAIVQGKEHFSRVAGQLVNWQDTGIALFEAFRSVGEGRLGNISTRGRVGRGDNVMIGGFIIEGGRLEVAIRAIGPSLEDGRGAIPGRIANPTLQLYSGATVIAENDNWRDDPAEVARIEARSMQPAHEAESVLIRWLDPGPYTAILRGHGDHTGIALVEVFDLGGEGRLAGLLEMR